MYIILIFKNFFGFTFLKLLKYFLPISKIHFKNLLLINTGQIGDLIISSLITDRAEILKTKFNKIYFLIKYEYEDLFRENKNVNLICWNYKKYKFNIFYRIKFLLGLRKLGFKNCFNLTAARGVTVDEISLLSSANNIYALNSNYRYLTKLFGKKLDKMYTKILAENILNEYDKNIEVLKFLGIDYRFDNINNKKVNIKSHDNYKYEIAVAPFSSIYNRDWGTEQFFKLISRLADNYKVLLLGSLSQKKKLEIFRMDNVTINAGDLALNELYDQIMNVKLFIGLDSGLSHIALKVGTPFIAIIGGGNFGRFLPYEESPFAKYLYHKMDCFGCEWRCIHKEPYCLTEVTVDDVLSNLSSLLNYAKLV